MKIDFSAQIKDTKGNPLPYGPGPAGPEGQPTVEWATLGLVCGECVDRFKPETSTWIENVRRAKMIYRLTDGGEQDLTADEVKQLVEAVGQHHMTHVASECVRMLDPEAWERA